MNNDLDLEEEMLEGEVDEALWLESAKENFDEAVGDENFFLAKNILADVLERGFHEEADHMRNILRKL